MTTRQPSATDCSPPVTTPPTPGGCIPATLTVSISPAGWPGPSPNGACSAEVLVTRRFEPLRPAQARRPALGGHAQRQLPRGFVDHLVAEHRRAAVLGRRVVAVGVQDELGALVVVLPGREGPVDDVDLARVQDPFAVVAERGGAGGRFGQAVEVTDRQVGPVDRRQPVAARRHQDPEQRVVVGIGAHVPGGLRPHPQRPHADAGHEVGRAEHQRPQPGRRGRDLVHRRQPPRVLDLRLDADPAGLVPGVLLDLAQHEIQPDHVAGPGDLGQDEGVQATPGGGHHLGHVAIGPPGGGVVDPDRHQLAAPAAGVQRGDHVAPGRLLGRRGDRVLEIEEHLVGGEAAGLVQEPLAAARHRQAGAPGTIFLRHFPPASRLPWDPVLVSQTPPALIAEATKRAGLIWIVIDGQDRPRPAWHVWRSLAPGAAYVVTGPGEQPLPGLAGAGRVTVIVEGSQASGGRVAWTAAVTRVEPGSAEWDEVIGPLVAGRLNAVLAEGETSPARRWATSGAVFRLAPVDAASVNTGSVSTGAPNSRTVLSAAPPAVHHGDAWPAIVSVAIANQCCH